MRNRMLKYFFILSFVLLIVLFYPVFTYLIADYEYEQMMKKNPLNRAQVEKELFFYVSKEIEIEESLWGKTMKLKDGDYCQQYLILGREPIDVIYDNNDRVMRILSSYE